MYFSVHVAIIPMWHHTAPMPTILTESLIRPSRGTQVIKSTLNISTVEAFGGNSAFGTPVGFYRK